jgi:hypothetical protein
MFLIGITLSRCGANGDLHMLYNLFGNQMNGVKIAQLRRQCACDYLRKSKKKKHKYNDKTKFELLLVFLVTEYIYM